MKSSEDKNLWLRTALHKFFKKHANELRILWETNSLRKRQKLGEAAYETTKEDSDREWQNY